MRFSRVSREYQFDRVIVWAKTDIIYTITAGQYVRLNIIIRKLSVYICICDGYSSISEIKTNLI